MNAARYGAGVMGAGPARPDRRPRPRGARRGAWAVAPMAGEWIHHAALAIKTKTPISVLRDTVAQFPTFTEAYLKGVESLEP